jgi:DNA repair photolyase
MIQETLAKSALSKHEHEFPTAWDVNPYRGCTMGCRYCFAQYSHKYLNLSNFFSDIVVKTNIAEILYSELRKKSWKGEQIKLGGISDIYQYAEKKYELMPQLIDVLKKTRNPIFIQTKSTMIMRDYELIKELAKYTTVDIATSICSFDETARKIIEPGAPTALERMEMLRQFTGVCRHTIVSFMPVIPLISDTNENLDTAFRLTKEFNLDSIIAYPLHLRGKLKVPFFQLIQNHFPEIYPQFSELYKTADLESNYANNLFQKIARLREKYQLFGSYSIVQPKDNQLSLF